MATVATTNIEVRYAETDQMGVVHHSSYIIWCEVGRTQLIKKLGLDYAEMERGGILSPVTEITLQYKHPAKYGEEVVVETNVHRYNGVRIEYYYEIKSKDGLIYASGTSSHVCVWKENFKPILLRKHAPEWHKVYEKEANE